jgi:iron complex outermembrane recepter protein
MGDRSRHRSADIATVVSSVLRAASICAPVALLAAPALAQTHESAALGTAIPAQPIAPALGAFARQTGLQLVYVSGVIRNQRSRAVPAGLQADEALGRLLQGTGLRFEHLTPRSIHILAAAAVPLAITTGAPGGEEVHEVIVTANRREENLQDVPITIQVLTGEALARLNATTFDDFVTNLPGVTAHGVGPGQNNIYIRGLATTQGGIQSSGILGPFPNVAVYLDDQSTQLPGRNLDVYAADLERIEILEGPQGTLFGAGAEAGVVRYITNKPKLDMTEAAVNAGYATTAHGDQSSNLDATLNIPLIADRLAVRGVIYNDSRGGYINNLPSTFTRENSDVGIHYANYPATPPTAQGTCPNGKPPSQAVTEFPGFCVPPNSVVLNNSNLAANAINPVTYQGIRAEVLYQFNQDWSALLAQSYQNIEADGVFAEMAANSLGEPLPDLSVALFNPSYDKDKFENTALTIEGRIGAALKLVYAGAYLVRNVEQIQDYTSYSRAVYAGYYQCANPQPGNPATGQCFTPSSTWHDVERNTHQSHELRVSTPGDWRIRGVGGLFYEKYQIQEQVDWFYLSALPYFNPIGPPTGYYTLNGSTLQPNGQPVAFYTPGAVFVSAPVTSINPNTRLPGDAFFDDITRGYTQRAAYASVEFELIPSKLTLTAGTRYSSTETSEVGSDVGSFYCNLTSFPQAPNPCVNHSNFTNLNAEVLDRTFSGFRSRANLSWKVTEDALLYYTWSQGFRAGGFNRLPGVAFFSPLRAGSYPWQATALEHGGWVPPLDFAPDSLTNNEVGWKTTWMNQRIQWDGAVYQEDWNDAQISVGAASLSPQGITFNGGNYRVRGLETSGVARVAMGFTIEARADWNHSELVQQSSFLWRDGTPIDFSTLHTASGQALSNPDGALGSSLAGAPPFQGNIRARYDFAFDGYAAFAQIGAVHQSHSLASTNQLASDLQGNSTAYNLPAFTMYDSALGFGKDAWLVQAYGQNLTDTRAQLYANYFQWYKGITISRPRTIGLRFSYQFSGS